MGVVVLLERCCELRSGIETSNAVIEDMAALINREISKEIRVAAKPGGNRWLKVLCALIGEVAGYEKALLDSLFNSWK